MIGKIAIKIMEEEKWESLANKRKESKLEINIIKSKNKIKPKSLQKRKKDPKTKEENYKGKI